jgi:hypothetical protein
VGEWVVPQVIALALLGAGLYAGYRWYARASRQIIAQMKRAEDELQRRAAGQPVEKDLGMLEYDPASGVYKPVERR